jgi:hypothetical protein
MQQASGRLGTEIKSSFMITQSKGRFKLAEVYLYGNLNSCADSQKQMIQVIDSKRFKVTDVKREIEIYSKQGKQ